MDAEHFCIIQKQHRNSIGFNNSPLMPSLSILAIVRAIKVARRLPFAAFRYQKLIKQLLLRVFEAEHKPDFYQLHSMLS